MHGATVVGSDKQPLPLYHGHSKVLSKTLYLDGLRGLAAFLVYMQHQTGWFYGQDTDIDIGYGAKTANGSINHQFASLPVVRLLYNGGSAAVAVFFVLSGYVLSKRSLQMISEGEHQKCMSTLKSAVIRRPFRLYLPVILVTLIFVLWLHIPFGFAPKVNLPSKQPGLLSELSHALQQLIIYLNPFQQHGWFIAWFPYNGTLWTIPIELKGSMLVFGTVAVLNLTAGGRIQRYQLATLFLIASFLLLVDQWTMSLFAFGVFLSAVHVREVALQHSGVRDASKKYPHLQAMLRHFELLAALYLLSQPVKGQEVKVSSETPGWYLLTKLIPASYEKDEYYRFYHSIGAVMLVHAVSRIVWIQQVLITKALLFLGRVSFSFYLVHIPVLWVYGDRAQRLLGVEGRNWNGPLWVDAKMAHVVPDLGPVGLSTRFLVVVWGVLPIILVLSELATRYVDEPSIRFSRWLSFSLGFDSKQLQVVEHQSSDIKGVAIVAGGSSLDHTD